VREARLVKCPTCDADRIGSVVGTAVWSGHDASGDRVNPSVEYALAQCGSCGDVSLQAREDFGLGFDGDEPFTLYPPQRILPANVPSELRKEWTEATKCFGASAFTACGVMVRRVLEGVCQLNGVSERTLAKSLEKMKEVGHIDSTLYEWASALRLVGNRGAHFGDELDRQDALDVLDFAEALLNNVYVLRARFAQFQARMTSRP